MDKKAKKRIDLLQQKLQKLRQTIAGVKKQLDDPEELRALEKQVADTTAEIEQLKKS